MITVNHKPDLIVPVSSGRGDKEPLQVRIPTNVKRAFKSLAALRGIEPNVLFVEIWEHYQRTGAAAVEKRVRND